MSPRHQPTTSRATTRNGRVAGSVVVALAVLLGGRSPACQICLPFPTDSLADRILAAEHLVLARENPERPFTLTPVRILGGEETPPLDLFLDSSSRRWLSHDESRSILCGWDPDEGQWLHLTRHDETIAPVVRDILSHREQWQADPESRYRYFADYLGNDNATLADLAHLEVARAPYDLLVRFADRIPRERLLEELGNVRRIEWQALYILLLAQSDHPDDHSMIRDRIERNARVGITLQTAAWATALIEIDGAAGIERLSKLYLGESECEPEELTAVHAALRVQADKGRPELREPIVALYGKLLERNPSLAPNLADDLTKWSRFDHAAAFVKLLEDRALPGLTATARIRQHLIAAEKESKAETPSSDANPAISLAVIGGLLLIALLAPLAGRREKSAPPTREPPKPTGLNR